MEKEEAREVLRHCNDSYEGAHILDTGFGFVVVAREPLTQRWLVYDPRAGFFRESDSVQILMQQGVH